MNTSPRLFPLALACLLTACASNPRSSPPLAPTEPFPAASTAEAVANPPPLQLIEFYAIN